MWWGGAEGGRAHQALEDLPGGGVDAAHLEGGLLAQRGKQKGKALGQHGLPLARASHHEEVVVTGGGDLQGPFGLGLALHVPQVQNL